MPDRIRGQSKYSHSPELALLTQIASNSPLHGPLHSQVALVTGAGQGIGQSIAVKLAALGAYVVLAGRRRSSLETTATAIQNNAGQASASSTPKSATEELSSIASVIECDVTDLRSVEALAQQIEQTCQRLDILVNNAGMGGPTGPLHQLAPENWDQIFNTNLRGVYYCIHALAPLMIAAHSGHIINISSLAGKNALPNGAAYAASKWGLNGLTYSVAEELRPHNIRVSVICPGSVNTDFSPHAGKNAEKMLQAEDVAHAVAMIVTQAPQSFASEILLRPTQKP
jgi:NAD(P)-dependent dehydrogenase (short-subunit alcohol dehydrogenase family)